MGRMIWLLLILIGCASKNPYITGGIIDLRQNRTEEAIHQFQKAIEVEPKNPDGYIWLGKAYATKKKFNPACDEFEKAFTMDPTKKGKMTNERDYFWAIYFNAGIEYLNKQDFVGAEKRLKEAVDWSPDSSVTYNHLGLVYSQLDRDEEAIQSYRKSITLKPNDPEPRIQLARILMEKERLEDVIPILEEALAKNPESSQVHYYLGVAYFNKEMKEEARSHFQKAIELDPEYKDAYLDLGVTLIQQGQYPEALTSLKRVTELDEKDKEAWYLIGTAHLMMKEYDRAIEALTHSIEIDPSYADAYYQRGVVKREKGLKKQAAEDFKRAEELKKGK